MTAYRRGMLSDLFEGVVVKKLTAVETITPTSNQHEIQGTKPLRRMFGDAERRQIPTRFVWLGEDQDGFSEEGFVSWSNVRKGKPRAPEYHLYYSGNDVTEAMKPGDSMFLALRPDGSAMMIVTPAESTIQNQLLWLFGIDHQPEFGFEFKDITDSTEIDFAARFILDELGIEIEEPEADRLDELLEKFGKTFPTTREFSIFARSTQKGVSATDDPDAAIVAWMEREEQLFRRFERHIIHDRLAAGFMIGAKADVDGFMKFSISLQQRRKSRAGAALENHLEAIFLAHSIRYARGARTEHNHKPDFLFPGATEYGASDFPSDRLTMLGAKSTAKDRWRQVLAEAARIQDKHLFTLEPGISQNQTDQMKASRLQLVVPAPLHQTFQTGQQRSLMRLAEFISLVRKRQDA